MSEKKTQQVTLWLPESLKVDLMHCAAADDRKLSDYVTHVLDLHVHGHRKRACEDQQPSMRSE